MIIRKSHTIQMFNVGAAKTDITYFRYGYTMLGYGRPFHRAKGIESQLHSRAVIIKNEGKKICFVNIEVGFCTIYLKQGVVQKLKSEFPQLGLDDSNIMITAQHTHCSPAGYGQHFVYNIPAPGFKKELWAHMRNGIVQSIVMAHVKLKPAKLKMGTGIFDEKEEVAFNRSLDAYNENKEIKQKLKKEEWHLACDRDMKMLQFEDENGRIIANINWFGTHCTSVSNDQYKICADNKGYASEYFERYYQEKYKDENTICIFAQDACGDVSPNYLWDVRKQWTRGKYKDDYKSAQYTGDLQYQKARSISEGIKSINNFSNRIESFQSYIEFSNIICDPEFTDGEKNKRTSGACLGVSFLEGTVEGPGAIKPVGTFLRVALDIHKKNEVKWMDDENRSKEFRDYLRLKHDTQNPKHIAIEGNTGKFVWLDHGGQIPIPGILEKSITFIKDAVKKNKTKALPWLISRLPLQFFILGNIAIVGFPLELTTMSGRRLRKTLKDGLQSHGIDHVILSPYANAYAGYVTTPEEYMLQRYEGGHTLFGKWTLPALQTALKDCMDKIKQGQKDNSEALIFEEKDIWVY